MTVNISRRSVSLTYFRRLSIFAFSSFIILLAIVYSVFTAKNNGDQALNLRLVEHADRIAENFNDHIHANLRALNSFSISSTSYALGTENSWPMITLPDFAIRSWTTRQEMRATTLGILPIVTADKREKWEKYVVENHSWIEESHEWESKKEGNAAPSFRLLSTNSPTSVNRRGIVSNRNLERKANFSKRISSDIYTLNMEGEPVVDEGFGPFTPIWMTSPAPKDSTMINFNMLSHHLFWEAIEDCMNSRLSVLSRVLNFKSNGNRQVDGDSSTQVMEEPISSILYPIFDAFDDNSNIVAVLAAEINWRVLLENLLQDGAMKVICVVENARDQKFSFKIDGPESTFLGPGDFHEPRFSNLLQTRGPKELVEKAEVFTGTPLDLDHCPFLIHLYPLSATEEIHTSFGVLLLVSSLLVLLIFTALMFLYFENHSKRVRETNNIDDKKSNTVERERYPAQTKPLPQKMTRNVQRLWEKRKLRSRTVPLHLKDFFRKISEGVNLTDSTVHDILINATVMVAGICSLNDWGGEREREQEQTSDIVEMIQQSIIITAKRHGLSQIQMANDNLIAIVGSEGNDVDHAANMVFFACECRKRISEIFKSISTRALSIRFGIHSGNIKPKMTNVDNCINRFELFGDTLDIAYQMLENGKANRIHVSVDTAECLNLAGKSHWVFPRLESVHVKGIGKMSTFWVKPKACLSTMTMNKVRSDQESDESLRTISFSDDDKFVDLHSNNNTPEKNFESLVDHNTAILLRYLRAIFAKRLVMKKKRRTFISSYWNDDIETCGSILEEAKEVIQTVSFDGRVSMNPVDPSLIEISQNVQSQLRVYVATIGSAYRQTNSFHNFQHASRTVSSIDQMIREITSSSGILHTGFDGIPRTLADIAKELYTRTFSIDSDPVVQFAMVFSALVHGVDHMGISNQQLVKNGSPLASLYKKRCIIQQNSIDISWWLLMTDDYDDLRSAIYSDELEKRRFRQVLVNSVIATDTLDSIMKKYRDNNWNKVFLKKVKLKGRKCMDFTEKRNLQVTMIIEYIMQIAISSYRVQSFRTYVRWNERLFEEALKAYHTGTSAVNPAAVWYQSELDRFKKILIPLLLRLNDIKIFGDSGQIFLTQASENYQAWKSRGEVMVEDMVDAFSRRIVAVQEDTIQFS